MNKATLRQVDAGDAAGRDRREFIKTGLVVTAAALLPGIAAGGTATSETVSTAKKALVINAHQRYPGISEGRLNRTFAALIKDETEKKGYEVKETYIEHGYVIDDEVQKHLWTDVIITQSPVFWFGSPLDLQEIHR
jgi:modulator of drug activity B